MLVAHGMRPNAPFSVDPSGRVVQSSQPASHSQPEPPPLNSLGPPALRLSSGQRTPNAVIGPPERADSVPPTVHMSLNLSLPRTLIWCRESLKVGPTRSFTAGWS